MQDQKKVVFTSKEQIETSSLPLAINSTRMLRDDSYQLLEDFSHQKEITDFYKGLPPFDVMSVEAKKAVQKAEVLEKKKEVVALRRNLMSKRVPDTLDVKGEPSRRITFSPSNLSH